ncbi:MAG: hypothetical protein M1830_010180 [Pleopsidium flavum]|nr:MAG: hypothetical protein M1830_010180 [Pleopsidium flavum]
MEPPSRVIIDTDPGVDDILALLLALAAKQEEVEVLLLSITFGNIDVQNCLRNVVSLFHVLEKELEWRRKRGHPEGFETMKTFKPIVAVGAEEPLEDQLMMADYFHGTDGLGGIHSSHPHLTPSETWKRLFEPPPANTLITEAAADNDLASPCPFFTPSQTPAHQEMLRLLRENPPDTITIIAIGPLTNLAIAASSEPETFLRAKEVVVMGGAISVPGNMTPVAEFNIHADAVAAARVFALTSPRPSSTLPPPPPPSSSSPTLTPIHSLPPYPAKLSKTLSLTLFPLDITTQHLLHRTKFTAKTAPLIAAGSPLAEWTSAFLASTFHKITTLHPIAPSPNITSEEHAEVALSLHDPLCIWYVLTHPTSHSQSPGPWTLSPSSPEDVRIETSGQWTRGMCIVDRRDRNKLPAEDTEDTDGDDAEVPGDTGHWLDQSRGNRIRRVVGSPGVALFEEVLLERIFG